MYSWKIPVVVGALFFLTAVPVCAMTCDECNELDKNIESTNQEMATQEAELQRAFAKKEFAKANQAEKRIAALSKKLVELDKSKNDNCKDACKPEVIKKAECVKLLSAIAEMEADASSAEANKEQIDEKYKALLHCHQELQQLSK
jgi:hypothetical protein